MEKSVSPLGCEYTCKKCDSPLVEAVQSLCCGERYCNPCASQISNCPSCKNILECFPDKAAQNIVDASYNIMTSSCCHKGCNWIGPTTDHKDHIENCCCKPGKCSKCNLILLKMNHDIASHKIQCFGLLEYDGTVYKRRDRVLVPMQESVGALAPMNNICTRYRSFKNHLSGQAAFSIFEEMHSDLVTAVKTSIQALSVSLPAQPTIPPLDLEQVQIFHVDGKFGWKIPNFTSLMAEVPGSTLYSSPFFTSPHGCKICLRIALNRNENLSLFICVLDRNSLQFPFRIKATTTLVNMKFGEDIKADICSEQLYSISSSDLEVNFGYAMFATWERVQREFLYHDNIFINCEGTVMV